MDTAIYLHLTTHLHLIESSESQFTRESFFFCIFQINLSIEYDLTSQARIKHCMVSRIKTSTKLCV